MPNEYIDWIVIPLTAGVVGYVTNAIAIHMLFRPYKPHWYTLGWQGIIPRTRAALASNVGKLVGEKLVTEQEIAVALQSKELHAVLQAAVYRLLTGDGVSPASTSENIKYKLDLLLRAACDSLAANASLRNSVDIYAAKAIHKASAAVLNLQCATVASWAQQHASDSLLEQLRRFAKKEARDTIDSFIQSGKSLADMSEGAIDTADLASVLTEQLLPMLSGILSRPALLDRLSGMLITYKDEQSAGNMLKRAAANAFLSDEKIVALVRDKVPDMANDIATDAAVCHDITTLIEQKLQELLHKPLSEYAAAKPDDYDKFLHTVSTIFAEKAVPAMASEKIAAIAARYDGMSLREAMSAAGVELNSLLPASVPLSSLLLSGELRRYIKDAISSNITSISLSTAQLETLSTAITGWIVRLLLAFVPQALRHLNITAVVEEKINSLAVKDVENMLFSFMSSHFRWINILGFVIGFIIGLGQMMFIKAF
ncbi:MAG: DUF445 domain-containing protein [Deferribacteraceae bacterium]|jgi:uncharacterized membrane protein YheB (UPF0754 family)|nr:DUF445 domain-containing protein [Deferribacteraceae bacterium]